MLSTFPSSPDWSGTEETRGAVSVVQGEERKRRHPCNAHRSQSLEDISKYSEANSANSVLSLRGLIYRRKKWQSV